MRVVTNASGRLETTGSWDDALATEAAQRARIAATRSEIRAMLEGNLQFHIDPLAAPAVTAPQPAVEVAAPQPVQPGPDGIIGYFRWLGPRTPNRTTGKTYPVIMSNERVGTPNDNGSMSATWPMPVWRRLLTRMLNEGRIELCDKDGVKLCT